MARAICVECLALTYKIGVCLGFGFMRCPVISIEREVKCLIGIHNGYISLMIQSTGTCTASREVVGPGCAHEVTLVCKRPNCSICILGGCNKLLLAWQIASRKR